MRCLVGLNVNIHKFMMSLLCIVSMKVLKVTVIKLVCMGYIFSMNENILHFALSLFESKSKVNSHEIRLYPLSLLERKYSRYQFK